MSKVLSLQMFEASATGIDCVSLFSCISIPSCLSEASGIKVEIDVRQN